MSKSNVQMQLTQWVLKKGEKRTSDDNTELSSKKIFTNDSEIVERPQLSNSNASTKESSRVLSHNNERTANVSTTIDMNIDVSGLDSTYSEDIGYFLRTSDKTLSDHDKAKLINMDNIPPNDFVYPFTLNIKNGKRIKRSLRKNYFEQYKWLTYSKIKCGLFCKYCVIFSVNGGRYNTITLKKFVTEPLTKFSKLTGKEGELEKHNKNRYHINAIQIADDFLKNLNNPKKDVIN